MTFARIQALCELVRRYKYYAPATSEVIVIISFALLPELRAKCTKSMIINNKNIEYFMGCQVVVDLASDYLAVAYMNINDGQYHDISEITNEDMT